MAQPSSFHRAQEMGHRAPRAALLAALLGATPACARSANVAPPALAPSEDARLSATAPATTATSTPGGRNEAASEDASHDEADAETPPPRPRPNRALPFALLGAGAAIAGAGLVMGVVAGEAQGDLGRDQARTLAITGDVLGGIGLATAAVGVVVLVVGPPRPARPLVSASVEPRIGVGSAGVQVVF